MRGLKTTIALVVVLGGLFAYIYFVTWKTPAEDTSSKLEKVFAGLQSDKIDEIRVHAESGDSTSLKKDKDGWKIVEPMAAAAQESEASGIANALSQLEVARVIDEKPSSLADYGLGAPRVEIQFKASGDKDFKKLFIGQKTPTGANLFAKRNDDNRVFTIASFQDSTFNRSTFDLRDKTVIKFDRDKVDHVEVTADNKTIELAKTGGDWKLMKPIQAPSDSAAAEGLIGKVQSVQMKSIVTENVAPADLKKYGLDKPTASITLTLGSAKASLLLGGKAGDGSLYAKDASKPLVMTVDPKTKTGLDSPALTVYAKFDDGKKEERLTFAKTGSDVYAGRPGEAGAAKVNPTEYDEVIKKLDELAK